MNSVIFTIKATRQLRKIQKQDAQTIFAACESLANMPICANVKALTNHEYDYRLRVGNYRVFFNFDGKVQVVSIEEVKKRDERTY